MPPAERVPRPRARVTFGRSPKSDQKRCLKPQVSRLPARLWCAETRRHTPREAQIAANRRTANHLRSSYRCRSHVPCGGLRWPTAVAIIKSPTCRQRRQVLVRPKGPPFYIGRAAHCDSIRGSGSGDRSTSDSLWNLFVPQLQTGKRKSKSHWFLAAFFPPFLSLLKEMGPPEAQREPVQRAAAAKSDPRPRARVSPFGKK